MSFLQLRSPKINNTLANPPATTTNYTQSFTGNLSFAGSIAKTSGKGLTAVLSFVGSVIKLMVLSAKTGTLSFSGSFSKRTSKSLSGTLTFIGTLANSIRKSLTATLSFSGNLLKVTVHSFTATLSFIGSLTKRTVRSLAGTLSFIGALAAGSLFSRAFTATLSFSGSLTKSMRKPLGATLSFVGTFTKFVPKSLTATLSFVGSLIKRTSTARTAALSFVGALTAGSLFRKALSGTLSFAGTMTLSTRKSLTATLSFSGALRKAISKGMTATLSFVGTIIKRVALAAKTATLSFSGSLLLGSLFKKAFTATLSFVGTVAKSSGKSLSGTLAFSGSVRKSTKKNLSGTVSFIGNIGKLIKHGMSSVLDFFGLLDPQQVEGTFEWKGYTWRRRTWSGAPQYNGQWLAGNVSSPDSNGYVNLSITNPTGTSPFAAEFSSDIQGWGYGTYTTVVGTQLNGMQSALVWGGMFTYDDLLPPAHNEIDVNETSAWGLSVVRTGHNIFYPDGLGGATEYEDRYDTTSDVVTTHQMIWEPTSITWRSYAGTGTSGTLLEETKVTTNLPTPANERVFFNIWVNEYDLALAAAAPAFTVTVRDFTFAEYLIPPVFVPLTVTIKGAIRTLLNAASTNRATGSGASKIESLDGGDTIEEIDGQIKNDTIDGGTNQTEL